MDELLRDFLMETGEHVDAAGAQLVRLERDPSDAAMIGAIFRLLHTIKGTCGFLGLARLSKLAHAAEALLNRLREGAPATGEAVSLILAAVDRIKFLLAEIERRQAEPEGSDEDLIAALARETNDAGRGGGPSPPGRPLPRYGPEARAGTADHPRRDRIARHDGDTGVRTRSHAQPTRGVSRGAPEPPKSTPADAPVLDRHRSPGFGHARAHAAARSAFSRHCRVWRAISRAISARRSRSSSRAAKRNSTAS